MAAIRYDQFMDRIALGARNSDQNARSVQGHGLNGVGNQEVQVVQRLCTDTKGRKRFNALITECGRQEFNYRLAATLPPFPNLSIKNTGNGVEL
jgi:hypothetical protein